MARLRTRRGSLIDGLAVHHQITGDPANLTLPGQLDKAFGIGDGEHVGMGRGHVQMGGEAGETGAGFLHVADGVGGDEFRALDAEQVRKADQKIFDAFVAGDLNARSMLMGFAAFRFSLLARLFDAWCYARN